VVWLAHDQQLAAVLLENHRPSSCVAPPRGSEVSSLHAERLPRTEGAAAAAGGCRHYTGSASAPPRSGASACLTRRAAGMDRPAPCRCAAMGACRQSRSHESARGQRMACVDSPVACACWSLMLEAVCVQEEESPSSGAALSRSQPLGGGRGCSLGGPAGPARWPAEPPPAGPRQGALATRRTALLGACWVGRSSAGAGAGAAVSQAYASARSALKNASFQCIPGRP
jgi:hypothetical protein